MTDTSRYDLITSFLDIPKSNEELHWLVQSVQLAKLSASKLMDAFEQEGASNYTIASEEDPYVQEHTFFREFEESRNTYHRWLAIEREISHLTERDTNKLSQHWQESSQFLQMVASNLVHSVTHGKEILERAQRNLSMAIEEADDYGPENKEEFDDEWFRLQNWLDAAQEEVRTLEETLPLCWQTLRNFVSSPQLKSYLPSQLIIFVEQNNQENFITENIIAENRLEIAAQVDIEFEAYEGSYLPWSTSEYDIP